MASYNGGSGDQTSFSAKEDALLQRPFEVEVETQFVGGDKLKFVDILTPGTAGNTKAPAAAITKELTIKIVKSAEGQTLSTEAEFRGALRSFMQDLLQDLPRLDLVSDPITLADPFRPLLYKFDELVENSGRWDPAIRFPLDDLLAFLLYQDERTIHKIRTTRTSGLVEFDNLWMAFVPGETVVKVELESCRCFYLEEVFKTAKDDVERMAFRGKQWMPCNKRFGYTAMGLSIPNFAGHKKISELSVVPLRCLPNGPQITSDCVKRGRRWIDLWSHVACQDYEGDAEGDKEPEHVSGRVVVDVEGYYERQPSKRSEISLDRASRLIEGSSLERITDEELMLLPDYIPGYSINRRLWLQFMVVKLTVPSWRTSVWDNLQVPDKTKDCIMKLVKHHQPPKLTEQQRSLQKAFGLVFLLSGPPGTGKTLTAECLAETLQKPLVYIVAQDVMKHSSMDTELARTFRQVKRWNAVVLIDEADDFLQRNTREISGGQLYQAFIKTIETFSGILIMTTNYTKKFEPAFLSRVSAKLSYSTANTQRLTKALTASLEESFAFHGDSDSAAAMATACTTRWPRLDFRMIDSLIYIGGILARAENPERPELTQKIIETAIALKGMSVDAKDDKMGNGEPN